MRNEKVFILDFDDTLCATKASRRVLLVQYLNSLGGEEVEETLKPLWGAPFQHLVESVISDISWHSFLKGYIDLMEKHPPVVLPGAREFLTYLQSKKIVSVVVSSSLTSLVRADLRFSRLQSLVGEVWGVDDTEFAKPDLRVMTNTMNALRKRLKSFSVCGYVADSVSDGFVARGWGWRFTGLLTGDTTREEFVRAGFRKDQVFEDLTEFLKKCGSKIDDEASEYS